MIYSLAGTWDVQLEDGKTYPVILPGTLDESKIGYRDTVSGPWHPDLIVEPENEIQSKEGLITTRFTRNYTYEGIAIFIKRIFYFPPEGKRIFLEVERARHLRLLVDGKEIVPYVKPSISTPYVFEVTGLLTGNNEIKLLSDNSYPGMPHDDIVLSSAATDETQTNWNGVLGYFRLRTEEQVFLSSVRVYPRQETLCVQVEIDGAIEYAGQLMIKSEALKQDASKEISLSAGRSQISFPLLSCKQDIRRWDEYEGNLYDLTAELTGGQKKTVCFGIHDFESDRTGHLSVNGRAIFLRSEANCAVFPETGYPPMESEKWLVILERFKSYGVNCVRFHSHCPPEAAFTAADQLGIMLQPELSHWNPRNALDSTESYEYYKRELKQILLF